MVLRLLTAALVAFTVGAPIAATTAPLAPASSSSRLMARPPVSSPTHDGDGICINCWPM